MSNEKDVKPTRLSLSKSTIHVGVTVDKRHRNRYQQFCRVARLWHCQHVYTCANFSALQTQYEWNQF